MPAMIETVEQAENNFAAFVKEALCVVPYGEPDETWREILLEEEMGEIMTLASLRWGPGGQARVERCFDKYCERAAPPEEPCRSFFARLLGK